jgi:hypothetical protein
MFTWSYWLQWVSGYTRNAYLLDNGVKYLILLGAAFVALLATWRVFRCVDDVTGKMNKIKLLAGVFLVVFAGVSVSFWNTPEIFVVATARDHVSDKYKFHMAYPGPSCGKNCRCKAGVIYYDDYLNREIEFCHWGDASSFFYTDYMRVDKLVSSKGGIILSHKAIH